MQRSNIVVETLLSKVSLVDLAERLDLGVTERSGSAKAICPFHDDRSPSLVLYESVGSGDRPHYHCFACGAHGDIFHLTQQKLSKTFPEAVIWLANQYGVPLQNTRGVGSATSPAVEIAQSKDGLQRALDIFAAQPAASAELSKLADERRFDASFLASAGVVIAMPGVLKRFALDVAGHRQLLADLETAGLLSVRNDKNRESASYHLSLSLWQEFFYDGRAIFPIKKQSGEVTGLAGRMLGTGPVDAPKYLYTRSFKRAENLYRCEVAFTALLVEAKRLKRAKKGVTYPALDLYIVEGLFDALRLESLGNPAVSILGADLSSAQAEMISIISDRLSGDFGVALHCHIFLDRDEAGIRGAAKAMRMLLTKNVEADLIWTLNLDGKDPDEILKQCQPDTNLRTFSHPPLLVLLADALGVTPSEILRYSGWDHVSPQRFRTSVERIIKTFSQVGSFQKSPNNRQTIVDILSRRCGEAPNESGWWIQQFLLIAARSTTTDTSGQGLYIEDLYARLDYARNLAWSSIQRGELPVDELAWRRIDRVSNLFNRGLVRRLADATDIPIDPFDTIYVPRGFDQPEHRTKSLPGPEDLVLQQYILAELLSERFGDSYRNCIPAVRFSRRSSETITTGESNDNINYQTLSFAYQVDTDVLEGWSTPRESGIFRHYWDCWQDFIGALRSRTSRMEGKIHSVRLDLKRYYDNIQRAWVRDILIPSVQRAVNQEGISEKLSLALSISPETEPNEIASRIVEWILKQSFGYDFYSPVDGKVINSAANVGLPQGPDLSAYLATIALFPVDRQMRNLLERINTDEESPHAVYVRYVDDIILVADSEQVLTQLRSELEDALRGTNLQAVNKHGPVYPMSKTAFSASLTENRAFTASMPAPGFCLSPDGDGAAYFEDGLPETRSDALIVLNDPRLYFANRSAVLSGISAALAVHGELRHNEFVKAARWLWYLLSQRTYASIQESKSQFFALWQEAFGSTQIWSGIDVKERPWSDPAAYAIEGLDRLLSDKVLNWFRFTENEKELIGQRLRRLADLVALPDIHCFFTPSPGDSAAPEGWGHGLQERLNRMFIQRLGAIRGKAYLLLGQIKLLPWELQDMSNDPNLSSSLRYLKIGIIESSGVDLISSHNRDGEITTWSIAFALLHEAIARLRAAENSVQDPIKGLGEFVTKSMSETPELTRNIVEPLLLWFETDLRHSKSHVDASSPVVAENRNIFQIALNSFVAATPARVLGELLSHRFHLLKQLCGGTDTPILAIPMVTVASIEEELPFLYFFCGTKLFALSQSETAPNTKFFEQKWTKHPDSTPEISSWWIEPGPIQPKKSGSVSPVAVRAVDVHKLGTTVRALIEQALTFSDVGEMDMKEKPISAAHIYCFGEDAVRWDVVSDPVDGSLLGNRAFLRDGSAGLRSISVPLEDAWLWRIGVALTDYFGFADDLDHFAPLPTRAVKSLEELEEPLPAWHIMREGLYRLRGDLASKRPGVHNHNTLRFVPTGIFRLIGQLERFPSDDLKDARSHQMAFLLAIMGETEAMRLRLSETWNFSQPGVVVGLCYHLASNILRYKLKAQWSDWLPHADENASVMRRPVSALMSLSSRVRKLPAPDTTCSSDNMAWNALLSGLDYVVATLAIRLCVVELFAISDPDDILIDSIHDWSCVGYFLPSRNNFDRNLLSEFRRATSVSGGNALLENISPMGWATLLRALFVSLAQKMSAQWADSLSKEQAALSMEIDTFIGRVSIQGSSHEDEVLWPFDAGVSSWITAEEEGESIQSLALKITARVDSAFGFRTVEKEDDHFSYRDQQFNSTYHLPHWRLTNWWPDRQRESRLSGERYVYPWTEVWQGERLVSVATSSAPLARLSRPGLASPADAVWTTQGSTPTTAMNTDITIQAEVVGKAPATLKAENTDDQKPRTVDAPPESEHSRKSVTEKASNTRFDGSPPPLQQLQHRAWRDRSSEERNLQHVRVALFQWDLADTYRHPLVDCGIPPDILTAIGVSDPTGQYAVTKNRRGDEHHFDQRCDRGTDDGAISLLSWAEHRRQQLLRSAITTCAQFKVEVLVLPEYSVRPETILFIKNLLNDIDGAPAVYAGTYRMFGGALPGRQREKLGLMPSKTLDHQAILTLVERESESGEVTASTRSKRYPSAAANEFFSPSTNIRSLFLERRKTAASFDPLSVFIELVCSELFIATSPSNIYFLADEYEKLLTRFGHKSTRKEILTQVENDIREYANRTSFSRSREFWPRRSILVVPAMTSRSADYWLFGQSAMLSSSMTTVFCNAVSGKHSVGGSCFIGRASWHQDESGEALLVPTPYHGWSHGIFYSGRDDPLSPTEQALVIADIDPLHMAEGKPRPQSLSNPLQLVAYLPVIESLKNVSQTSSYACFDKVSKIASDLAEKIHVADDHLGVDLHQSLNAVVSDLDRLAEKCLDGKYFKRRTAAWRNDSKEQPYFGGLPPALVDWLWVDLTPRVADGVPEIPKLLVPPWAS